MHNFFINSEYCSECVCLGKTVGNGVPNALVGNGFCNDDTNNVECNYDGGDCCENVKTDYCSECNCYLQMSWGTSHKIFPLALSTDCVSARFQCE